MIELLLQRSLGKFAGSRVKRNLAIVTFAIYFSGCCLGGNTTSIGNDQTSLRLDGSDRLETEMPWQDTGGFMEGAAALASGAAQAFKEGSSIFGDAASLLSEQYANLLQVAGQTVTNLAEQKALETTVALKNAAARLNEQQAAFVAQLADQGVQLGERLAEGPEVLRLAALAQLTNWKTKATEVATQTAAQLVEGVTEGQAALTDAASHAAARLAEQQATLREKITAFGTQLSERQAAMLKNAAIELAERQAAFVQAAGQAAAQLAEKQTEIKQTATLAAAQLVDRLANSPTALREAAARLDEQHVALQQAAQDASDQLSQWKTKATEIASQAASHIAEGVADKQAALVEAAKQAVTHLSEQQAVVRDSIASVGEQLHERRVVLVQAASHAASQLTQFCIGCGQDALREATTQLMAQLAENEMLLRESGAHVATQLAKLQGTLSPSAFRIAAQLEELQRHMHSLDSAHVDPACHVDEANPNLTQTCVTQSEQPERPEFAISYLLRLRDFIQSTGHELPIACVLLGLGVLCMCSIIYTVIQSGGEDVFSLSYSKFLWRVATWFAHRVFLGWALLLLSDAMSDAPINLPIRDAMGWPTWSTLLPLSSQFWFFLPAAAILNGAVARGSSSCSSPESRRFYASLSREVHASIVGCFVSDWVLFPTNLTFLVHHLLGLGIIFGVWSMVLQEAKLLAGARGRSLTAINFWWITGLSVACMEASSFFYNLYSVYSFGIVLNVSLFAVFTYSNVLSVMCVLTQHPWGTSLKVIWAARSLLHGITEYAQATFPHIRIPAWLSSKTTSDSISYLWKSFMIIVICLARQNEMWCHVREQLSSSSVMVVGAVCISLAAASVRRLKDFEKRHEP